MVHEAIGLGVVLSFLTGEFLGIAAGGLVSPGYLAFYLEQPLRILSTLAGAALIVLCVRTMQRFIILFGRRRFMATVLLSLAGTWLFERFFFAGGYVAPDLRMVGYIVPGLVANDMLRQGILKTAAMLLVVAVVVRLLLTAAASL